MPITVLDGILIAIMLISALLAMVRGFAREVLSILSWVAAAAAAYLLYGNLLPFVKGYIANQQIALGVSVMVIFFVTLIIVSYITMRISDFILDSRIGALDRTLGFFFGAGRGLLLVVVSMMFFNWFVPDEAQPKWISGAKSKPILNSIGDQLVAILPEDPESEIFDRLRNRGTKKPPGEQSRAPEKSDPGYQTRERSGLNQLIKSSGN
jgi:membrane protein required for colicin V production